MYYVYIMYIMYMNANFWEKEQEVSPGGGRTGIGANGELCAPGRKYQHTRGV